MSSRQFFANHLSPSLQNPFISEITAKIVRLPAHCERNKDDTTIFAKLSHVSRRKCWERPHQPIKALYFTWLAYWPRSHATTYFDWSCLLIELWRQRGARTGTTSFNPRDWGRLTALTLTLWNAPVLGPPKCIEINHCCRQSMLFPSRSQFFADLAFC